MLQRYQGYVNYYMPEPRTVGFLPKCLLICLCAVQLMGLENSPLRTHRGSLAVPHISHNCIPLQEAGRGGGGGITTSTPQPWWGLSRNVSREMSYQRWLWAFLCVCNLFLNFLLKNQLLPWNHEYFICKHHHLLCYFPLVANFRLLWIISLLWLKMYFYIYQLFSLKSSCIFNAERSTCWCESCCGFRLVSVYVRRLTSWDQLLEPLSKM